MKKKFGIVADDHKVEKFKKELKAGGFKKVNVKPLSSGISTITIKAEDTDQDTIHAICIKVEAFYNRSN